MNEETKEVLAQLMDRALAGVDQAVEFSQQQIPEVIQQLLMWHSVEAAAWSFIGLLMAIAYWPIFKFAIYPTARKEDEATGDFGLTAAIGGGLSLLYLAFSFGLIMEAMTVIKIWIAPKLYLLEYGASLIK